MHVWGRKFADAQCGMEVRSDSVAALRATEKLAGTTPYMNFLAAEIALKLEELGLAEVQAVHIPGALNDAADALSRLAQPGKTGQKPAVAHSAKARGPGSLPRLLPSPAALRGHRLRVATSARCERSSSASPCGSGGLAECCARCTALRVVPCAEVLR